jgi:hypothetical protein
MSSVTFSSSRPVEVALTTITVPAGTAWPMSQGRYMAVAGSVPFKIFKISSPPRGAAVAYSKIEFSHGKPPAIFA